MTVTSSTLFRAAAGAAVLAGLIFIGVQINHPYLDATSITTTDVITRSSLKMLMAALSLVGITGIYLRQVTKIGVLGLLGYVLFAAGYLSIFGTEFVAALVLPSIADTANVYTNNVIAFANNRPATGDIGLMQTAILFTGITGIYLRQVTKIGVLGMFGFVLFAAGYLSIFGTEFVAALVLPSIAGSSQAYTNDVIAFANNRPATGDIGLMHTEILFTAVTYIGGGFLFAIAMFRANVLARWAAVLLALGTLATIAVGVVPQYERLFAIPTGLALVALGYSLWRDQRAPAAPPVLNPVSSTLDVVGAK